MRIVHLISNLAAGGAETMLARLVLSDNENEHVVVSIGSLGTVGAKLRQARIVVHTLQSRKTTVLLAMWRLWRLLKRAKPDVLQTWMYHSDLLGGVVGRLAGIHNICWNVRNSRIPQNWLSMTSLIIALCAALSYMLPKRIICCSRSGLQHHGNLGYCKKKIIYIPNGYSATNICRRNWTKQATRSRLRFPHSAFIITMVGRFDYLKGYDILVKAAGIVAAQSPKQCLFVMVGRNVTEENHELSSMIRNNGASAACLLMGERDDVLDIMYASDTVCLASRAEGFPNVVAEAMLMERLCVVTDAGDAAYIVGETGKVVEPCNPKAFADALLEVQKLTEDERQSLGREARERIVNNFEIGSILKRYVATYKELQSIA